MIPATQFPVFGCGTIGNPHHISSKALRKTPPRLWPWPTRIDFAPYRRLLDHGIHTPADIALADDLLRRLSPDFGRILDAAKGVEIKIIDKSAMPPGSLGYANFAPFNLIDRQSRLRGRHIGLMRGVKIKTYLHELIHLIRFADLPESYQNLFPKDLTLDPRQTLGELFEVAVQSQWWDEVLAYSSEAHLLKELKNAGYWIAKDQRASHGFIKKILRASRRGGSAEIYGYVSNIPTYQRNRKVLLFEALALKSRVFGSLAWGLLQFHALEYGVRIGQPWDLDPIERVQPILEFALAKRGFPLLGAFLGIFSSPAGMLLERVHRYDTAQMCPEEVKRFLNSEFGDFTRKIGEIFYLEPKASTSISEDFSLELLRASQEASRKKRRERYLELLVVARGWESPTQLPRSSKERDEWLLRQRNLLDLALALRREGEESQELVKRALDFFGENLWVEGLKNALDHLTQDWSWQSVFSYKHLPLRELVVAGFGDLLTERIFSRLTRLTGFVGLATPNALFRIRYPLPSNFLDYVVELVDAVENSGLSLEESDREILRSLVGKVEKAILWHLQVTRVCYQHWSGLSRSSAGAALFDELSSLVQGKDSSVGAAGDWGSFDPGWERGPAALIAACLRYEPLFSIGMGFLKIFPNSDVRLRLFALAAQKSPTIEEGPPLQDFFHDYGEALGLQASSMKAWSYVEGSRRAAIRRTCEMQALTRDQDYRHSHDYFWHQGQMVDLLLRHPELRGIALVWLRKDWSESCVIIANFFEEVGSEVPWAHYSSSQSNPALRSLQAHAGADWSRLRSAAAQQRYSVVWDRFQPALWKAELLLDRLDSFPSNERNEQLERVEHLLFRTLSQSFAGLKKAELYWRLAKAAWLGGHQELCRRLIQGQRAVFHGLGLRILFEARPSASDGEGVNVPVWKKFREYYDSAFSILAGWLERLELPRDPSIDAELAIDLLGTLSGVASSDFVRGFAEWTIDRYAASLLDHRDPGSLRSITRALRGLRLSDPECDELWARLILNISPEPGILRQSHWRGRSAWEFYRILDFVSGNVALPKASRLLKERVEALANSPAMKASEGLEAVGWLRLLAWIRSKELP